jgi:hypothetical protein
MNPSNYGEELIQTLEELYKRHVAFVSKKSLILALKVHLLNGPIFHLHEKLLSRRITKKKTPFWITKITDLQTCPRKENRKVKNRLKNLQKTSQKVKILTQKTIKINQTKTQRPQTSQYPIFYVFYGLQVKNKRRLSRNFSCGGS